MSRRCTLTKRRRRRAAIRDAVRGSDRKRKRKKRRAHQQITSQFTMNALDLFCVCVCVCVCVCGCVLFPLVSWGIDRDIVCGRRGRAVGPTKSSFETGALNGSHLPDGITCCFFFSLFHLVSFFASPCLFVAVFLFDFTGFVELTLRLSHADRRHGSLRTKPIHGPANSRLGRHL